MSDGSLPAQTGSPNFLPSTEIPATPAVSGSNPTLPSSEAPTGALTSDTTNQKISDALSGEIGNNVDRILKLRDELTTPVKLNFANLSGNAVSILLFLLPANKKSLFGNDRLKVRQLPFLSMLAMGSVMLTDGDLAGSLQSLWGQVAKSAEQNVLGAVSAFRDDLGNMVNQLETIGAASFNAEGLARAMAALEAAKATGTVNQDTFLIQVGEICNSLGGQSRALFELELLLSQLSAAATDLTLMARLPVDLLSSAENALASAQDLANGKLSQAVFQEGYNNVFKDLGRLSSLKNVSFGGPCGPNAVAELSALRAACQLADEAGHFIADENLSISEFVKSAVVSLSSQDMIALAERARNFVAPDIDEINLNIQRALQDALAGAACGGGSSELAQSTAFKIGRELTKITTTVSAIATIYASTKAMSQAFEAGVAMMQQLGVSSAVDSVIKGDLSKFFDSDGVQLDGELRMKILVKAVDDCAKKQPDKRVQATLRRLSDRIKAGAYRKSYMKTSASVAKRTSKLAREITTLRDSALARGG